MNLPPPRPATPPPHAFVLLTVLVMILLASMLAVSLMFSLRADVNAQAAGVRQEQAWAAAMSGVAQAVALAQASIQGPPGLTENSPALRGQFITSDGDDRWFFTVYSASDSPTAEVRFGLADEAGKLSLLHIDRVWLARLPGLDPDLVQSLVPSDTNATTPAAPPPTNNPAIGDPAAPMPALAILPPAPAPAPDDSPTSPPAPATLLSLEEAFSGAGAALALLHGEDANLNLRLDPNEDDGESQPPLDDRNGLLDIGLQRLLTVVSYEPNTDSQGHPRVNLNDPKADLSNLGLPDETRNYLTALHRAGEKLAHPVDLLDAEGTFPDAEGKDVVLKSGIGGDQLANLLDRCSTTDETRLDGLLNINTAPAAVLAAIPALGEAGADAVVAARPGLGVEERRTPAWLLQHGLVTPEQFRQLAPHLTTRSFQFSFHAVGYALPSGRYRALAAVIDVATRPARILELQDLTRLGFPMPVELLQSPDP